MIEFRDVRKIYRSSGVKKVIINRLNFIFPSDRNIGILGHNGTGKSTFMRLVAGSEPPTEGRIIRRGKVSWPLGFGGGFNGNMTGLENARFVARMYGEDTDEVVHFVEEFAELGPSIHLPIRTYSSGMKARLAFGVSMAIHFDTYLIDEITAVGDARFKKKCDEVFQSKLKRSNIIMVTHSMANMRKFCQSGCVLNKGEVYYYDDVEDAISQHEELQEK
ncbi:MAG: ABC transporter ATP-binding protein [Lentilitoribacter sp.]